MEIERKQISEINAAEYNPRVELQPGDEEYEEIKYSIETFGMLEPIIWNRQTNNVVSGHQRLNILKDQGKTDIDVVVVNLDPISEKQLNVALNKVTGRWDEEKLEKLLDELGEDAGKTGFTPEEIESLKQAETYFDSPPESQEPDQENFFCLTIAFDPSDKKPLKSYIKKNGDSEIVDTIISIAKNGI